MLSIKLDEKTATKLNWLAGKRNVDPNSLALEAIQTRVRAEAQQAMEQEADAFRHMHPELLKSIPGEYAAIYQRQLVDHDADLLAIVQRIEEKYRGEPVLIRRVQSDIEPSIHVYSPRIEHA